MKKTILSIFAIIGVSMSAFAAIPSVLTGPILNPANNHYYYLPTQKTGLRHNRKQLAWVAILTQPRMVGYPRLSKTMAASLGIFGQD